MFRTAQSHPLRFAPLAALLPAVVAGIATGVFSGVLAEETELEPLVPFHTDTATTEKAAAEAFGGFLRSDAEQINAALEVLSENTRVLRAEEKDNYGTTVGYSRSFRTTLNLAREYAYGGELEKSYEQVMWMQKACVVCHNVARGRNLLSAPEPR